MEATGQAATLKAVAQRWYPKPTVSWTDFNGANLTGETEFSNNSAGIFKVTSVLKTVKVDDSYDCIIENALVKSVSNALVTGIVQVPLSPTLQCTITCFRLFLLETEWIFVLANHG